MEIQNWQIQLLWGLEVLLKGGCLMVLWLVVHHFYLDEINNKYPISESDN